MSSAITAWTLITGIGILLVGNGLLGSSLGLRAALEGLTAGTIGLFMGGYFFGFLAGGWLCPPLIARVGHIRTFAALAAGIAAIAVVHHLWVAPWLWVLLRFLSGIGVVGLYLAVESWLNSEASPPTRARIFSVYMTVLWLALGGGQALLLLDARGGELAFGLVTILFCAGLIPVALTNVPEPARIPAPRFRLAVLRRLPGVGLAGTLAAGFVGGGFWGLGVVFAHGLGLSGNALATFMMAPIAGSVVTQIPIGRLSDRTDRRNVITAAAFAGTFFAVAILASGSRLLWLTIALAFAFGASALPLYALSVAHVNDRVGREDVLDASRAVLMIYGLGAAIGPPTAGGLMHLAGTWALPLYFAVPLLWLGGIGLWSMRVRPPVPAGEKEPFQPLSRTSHMAAAPDAAPPQPERRWTGETDNVR